MRFRYARVEAWPPAAWMARCDLADEHVQVFHGPRVETHEDWFCEAVWAGPFEAGDFDRTDLVFGSGGRRRGRRALFVPSGTTVDRLHSLQCGTCTWVSNSLPCLLAAASASPDPSFPGYFEDFRSIILGLRRYERTLATSAGPVRLTYFHNLEWDGARIRELEKPNPSRDFGCFAKYLGFLESSLEQLSENLAAAHRRWPYRMLGTLSSGYDSPTVVVLARRFGLREVISFDQARKGKPDSGQEIAERLGVRCLPIERDAWREHDAPEVPFLAADAKGEDVYFKGAEALLPGRVLMTGFHGDKVWGRDTATSSDDLVRGDQSGLSLSEYRLWIGFIHCPVPFLGARQARDIRAIGRSPEMKPWDVAAAYSRPICRRIVEEAGVPREAFGVAKKAASVLFFHRDSFLSPGSSADFAHWLAQRPDGRSGPRGRALAAGRAHAWRASARAAARLVQAVAEVAPGRLALLRKVADRMRRWGRWEPSFPHLFPWAIERAKQRYEFRAEPVDPVAECPAR